MRLVRCYVNAAFTYLSNHRWEEGLLEGYLGLVEAVPLSPGNMKASDGLRYHVLDVWVDELDRVDGKREGIVPVKHVMRPVRRLEAEGRTKKVRERARECLEDERLSDWENDGNGGEVEDRRTSGSDEEGEDDEWGGLSD